MGDIPGLLSSLSFLSTTSLPFLNLLSSASKDDPPILLLEPPLFPLAPTYDDRLDPLSRGERDLERALRGERDLGGDLQFSLGGVRQFSRRAFLKDTVILNLSKTYISGFVLHLRKDGRSS